MTRSPGLNRLDTLARPDYLARDLVTENERGLREAVPFHEVAPAYAARMDTHEYLAGTYFGNGHFLEPDIPVVVIHRYTHTFSERSGCRFYGFPCLVWFLYAGYLFGFFVF